MPSALISDIDGTLLYKSEVTPEPVTRSLDDFQKAGNLLGLCTGRAVQGCQTLIDALPQLTHPSIFFGGALIWDTVKGKALKSMPCDNSIFEVVQAIFEAYPSVSITLNTENQGWTLRTNKIFQTKGVLYDRSSPLITKLPDHKQKILKVLLTDENPEIITEIKLTLLDPALFHGVFASRHFFEITDSKVNKGTAIQHLFHLVPHLKEYKVWAAGDAPSDAMMKPYVDAFAAPVDAHPTVLSVADITFPSAKEEGISQFLASLKNQ